MPPDGQEFFQSTAGGSPWSQGNYQWRNAFDLSGIPGFQGQQGMLAGMMLQQLLPQILGPNYISAPFVPTGQNLQMHQQTMDFFRQQQTAMQLASQQNQEYYFRMIRGVSNMAGVQFGAPQQAAAQRLAQDMSLLSPMMARMAPEFWDQLHGMRGNPDVMALGMMQGGRMALDPVTGFMGLSGESAGMMTRQIYRNLYGGDTAAAMQRMSGLRAGQAGMMFDEMMQRGLGPAQLDRESMLRGLRGRGVDVDHMAQPQLDAAMRGFQADQVSGQLQTYSKAVKAVQEIFGDMGNNNAPMSQIFNALQNLTQGGVGRFSPAELERMVRETYTVSKMTRIGIDAMGGLSNELAQAAQARGLDRSFAVSAAVSATLAGHAYGTSGALAAGGWGGLEKAEYTRIAGQLDIQAASSDQAMQLGAIAMLGDRLGFRGAGATEANALAQAIREGRNTYTVAGPGGRQVTRSVFMAPGDYSRIMQAGGINQATIDELRHSPAALQETIRQHNIGGLVRQNQWDIDIARHMNNMGQGIAFGVLSAGGMGRADADRLSQEIGAASTRAIREIPYADLADPARRDAAIRENIKRQLKSRLGNVTDAQLDEIAMMTYVRETQFIANPNSGLTRYHDIQGLRAEHDPAILQQAAAMQREIAGITGMQSAVRGLGQAPFLSRFTEAISNAEPGQQWEDLVAQAMGGVKKGEVTARIAARMHQLSDIGNRMQAASRAGNKAEYQSLQHQAESLVGPLNKDFENAPNLPHEHPAGGAPAGQPPAAPTTPRASAAATSDANPQGRGRMEIAGTLRIEWPNTGNLSGHSADPRSGII